MIAISKIRASLKRECCSENTLPGLGDKDKEENGGGMEEGGEEAVMLVETEVEIGSLDRIKLASLVSQLKECRLVGVGLQHHTQALVFALGTKVDVVQLVISD